MKNKNNSDSQFWNAVTAISTSLLVIAAIVFGLMQYRLVDTQNQINKLLLDNQMQALIELSFTEDGKWLRFMNVGRSTATKIDVYMNQYGAGDNHSSVSAQDDLNPGDEFKILVPQPPVDEMILAKKQAEVLDVFLRYCSEDGP